MALSSSSDESIDESVWELLVPEFSNRCLIWNEISKARVVEKTQGKRVRIRELICTACSELVSS